VNVLTLEDPVEYELPGISQAQINTKKGVTFATGLRHLLRQDPDVIMVGEIRDGETARTAVQAALTGHMVFSTLHTNDAASAVVRLIDLGVEPYLVNACLSAVLAQRLVRTLCPQCGGQPPNDTSAPCTHCRGSGFRGRVGLYELLVLDEPLKDMVAKGASATQLERAARGRGMTTLRDAGLALAKEGRTSREEVDRVTLAAESPPEPPEPSPPEGSLDGPPKNNAGSALDEHGASSPGAE
jgi:type II secretory ATPase GspE/PulE/Tfp pilus assembly ATPase PilB-like protein